MRQDWGNDSAWDTSRPMRKVAEHRFASAGAYVAKVEVMDAYSGSSTAAVEVIPEFGGLVAPVVFMVFAVALA